MRVSIMAAVRVVARQPAFWLALLLVGAIGSMRWSAPFRRAVSGRSAPPLFARKLL
ncbi:protein of unknown function [Methylocella tundrae]|uniref:Uncharacterized protein n=1 Tax=Methylocella tundrae TaxID=227605 RepID=A0A4U8Z4Z1_METTU|nr:hypothetical protein [Methylocella tundrae]VFU10583.1 protein of unknown function [Methylocella tundrae]